jgi:hypothetical protein
VKATKTNGFWVRMSMCSLAFSQRDVLTRDRRTFFPSPQSRYGVASPISKLVNVYLVILVMAKWEKYFHPIRTKVRSHRNEQFSVNVQLDCGPSLSAA